MSSKGAGEGGVHILFFLSILMMKCRLVLTGRPVLQHPCWPLADRTSATFNVSSLFSSAAFHSVSENCNESDKVNPKTAQGKKKTFSVGELAKSMSETGSIQLYLPFFLTHFSFWLHSNHNLWTTVPPTSGTVSSAACACGCRSPPWICPWRGWGRTPRPCLRISPAARRSCRGLALTHTGGFTLARGSWGEPRPFPRVLPRKMIWCPSACLR